MASKAFPRIATLVLLLASTLPVLAQSNPRIADLWRAGLKEVDQKLRNQDWKAAAKQGRKVAHDIVETAGTGEGASYSLAVVSAFRAIAAAGMGDAEEAAWHWDTALNLFPDIATTQVAPYGPAAAELQRRQLREPEPDELRNQVLKLVGQEGSVDVRLGDRTLNVTRPVIVKQPRPDFPTALSILGADGVVVVSVIIGEAGRPRQPRVLTLQDGGPAMKYVALDSLREWRFEPAKLEGKPVAVYYALTVNFATRG
jgi:Gram-negative bacterial TonB protein C-terminal